MPTTITSDTAIEKSAFVITLAFTDSNGAAMTPNVGLNWTLTDLSGGVINARESVIVAPGETVNIVLTGNDLSFQPTENGRYAKRVLTVQGTYDSDLGSGISIKDEVKFSIINLVYVT